MTTKREPFKIVELSGKKFRIGRFDALTGSFIAFTVMTKMLPMIAELMGGDGKAPDMDALTAGMINSRASMSREDFTSLQKDCLGVCHHLQSINGVDAPVAILIANGTWGVADLEYDVATVLALTVHALFFNISSFFEEGTLGSMMEGFKGLPFSSVKE